MRNDHRPGHLAVGSASPSERLDDRRKIGTGIDEQMLDAVRGKRFQIVFGGNPGHAAFPAFRMACQTRSGVAGISIWVTPSGAKTSRTAVMIVCGLAMA